MLTQAARWGACVVHECDPADALVAAVAAVLSGAIYYSPEVLGRKSRIPAVKQATEKELSVLELAATLVGDEDALAENDNWDASSEAAFATAGAFPLPKGSKDAALIVEVASDASYTIQVKGVNSTTGEALIEVYDVSK